MGPGEVGTFEAAHHRVRCLGWPNGNQREALDDEVPKSVEESDYGVGLRGNLERFRAPPGSRTPNQRIKSRLEPVLPCAALCCLTCSAQVRLSASYI